MHGHRDPGRIVISHECIRRVDRAQKLKADLVLFSGAGMPGERTEAAQMRHAWHGPDVPLACDGWATSTAENAVSGARWLRGVWAMEVVLVTSWWHAPRCWLEWWRQPGAFALKVRPCRGSVRYVPGEVRALWRAVRHG